MSEEELGLPCNCSPKSRQQEIREELARKYGIDLDFSTQHISFSNKPPREVEIVHSEYVQSVGCTLYFWLSGNS